MPSHASNVTTVSQVPVARAYSRTALASNGSIGSEPIGSEPPGLHSQRRRGPPFNAGVSASAHASGDNGLEIFKNLHTLIVEDDLVDQKVTSAAARQLGLRPMVVPTAMEALDLLRIADRDDPFELLLIDFKIPTLDGLAASNLIKHELNISTIPKIILLSAYQKNEIFGSVADREFIDSFMTKPITPINLRKTLQQFSHTALTLDEQWPTNAKDDTESGDDVLAHTHVLLAEDNYINQRVATGMLKQKCIQVTIANNGQEAIDKIFEAPPGTYDVILMDVDMPEVDGFQATQAILQHPDFKNIPIIALTAHISPNDKQRCLAAGMVEYLTKPIKPDLLFDTIRNNLYALPPNN